MIKFDIAKKSIVNIKIFDISGRMILKLVDSIYSAGQFYIIWNPYNVPSGMYFIQLLVYTVGTKSLLFTKLEKITYLK